ncbi:serine/threonine protein kinase [Rubripirellula sp.]|nr:serine/threonine-protein kinase [Rubripirellula sp.]MDB4621336.1 serine/threonine protein kinase [Rubripirellula sp.]
MPSERMIQQSTLFIDKCIELKLVSASDAEKLREPVGEEGHLVAQDALQRGLLTPSDIEIVHSLLRPSDVVPGYEILDFVGRGGMGVVYRARQLDLERVVALKTVLVSSVGNSNTGARFELEAKALARMQHPNIVQALNFGKHEGRFYFAMEFIPGPSCEQLVASGFGLPKNQVWQIVRQVASGLLHASRQGLIHRDIKPANLILMPAPEGSMAVTVSHGIVKITDFGLAMFTDHTQQDNRLTTADKIIGSPAFMSPEQFSGGELDFRSDMYSLGATAWNLLFGEIPFKGASIGALYKQKLNPNEIAQNLSTTLTDSQWRLLMGLLDPDRERRPPSYEMLIDAIDQLDIGEVNSDTTEFLVGSIAANVPAISEEPTVARDRQTEASVFPAGTPTTECPVPLDVAQDRGSAEHERQGREIQSQVTLGLEGSTYASIGGRISRNARVLAGLVTLVVLLLTILVVNWLRPLPRGPREFKRVVASTPLFDGESLVGWGIDGSMVAAWNTVEAPDSSEAIACTTGRGALTRRLPNVDFFRISMFVWVLDGGGMVDIDFSVDFTQLSALRGTVRIDAGEIVLGTKNGDFGEVTEFSRAPLPTAFAERYHVIYIERQKKDWYVFLEQDLVGTIPISSLPEGSAIRVVVHGFDQDVGSVSDDSVDGDPRVFFSDLQFSKLAEEMSPVQSQ